MDEIKDQIYNNLVSNDYMIPNKDDPNMVTMTQKAIDLIDQVKNLPKGPKEQCFICNKHSLRKCYRCSNYFCDEHIENDKLTGDDWCDECTKFVNKMFK